MAAAAPGAPVFGTGERVLATWRVDRNVYPGRVLGASPDGSSYEVLFDNGKSQGKLIIMF